MFKKGTLLEIEKDIIWFVEINNKKYDYQVKTVMATIKSNFFPICNQISKKNNEQTVSCLTRIKK